VKISKKKNKNSIHSELPKSLCCQKTQFSALGVNVCLVLENLLFGEHVDILITNLIPILTNELKLQI